MVNSPTAVKILEPSRAEITWAPRKNSDASVSVTNTPRIRHINEYTSRNPKMNATIPAMTLPLSGQAKFLRSASKEVLRQASNGPTPVSSSRNKAIGIVTLLKNGGPTLILLPCTHSDSTGKRVPQRIAKQAASSTRLLNKKLDSRETRESSWLSLRK